MARNLLRGAGWCLWAIFLAWTMAALGWAAEAAGAFVKLYADGNELPASAAAWVMVRDTKTGLTWEVKSADGSLHDGGRQYTWQEAREVFVAGLNAEKFGGFDDWRLPNDRELASIMRRDMGEPFVDAAFFPNMRPANYWNFYICGSGAIMSGTQSFGKRNTRGAAQHAVAVRGREP